MQATENKLKLLPHQEKARSNFNNWFPLSGKDKSQEALIALTVGLGKTFTASACVNDIIKQTGRGILWVTHRNELIEQSSLELKTTTGIHCGILKAERTPEHDSLIVVASVQSLTKKRINELKKWFSPALIVFDEAHHSPAPTWAYVKTVFPNVPILNLTATPYRMDVRERLFLGEILAQMDISDGIRIGMLVPPVPVATIDIEYKKMKMRMGDFTAISAASMMMQDSVMKKVIEGISKNLEGRKGIVFSATVEHGKEVSRSLRKQGFEIGEIYGETPIEERKDIYQGVREGHINAIVNNLVCTEGFNMPELDFGAILRPTKNAALYIQMLGRVLRASDGKKSAAILDVVDAPKKRGGVGITIPNDDDQKKFAAISGKHYSKSIVFLSWFRRPEEVTAKIELDKMQRLNKPKILLSELGVGATPNERLIEVFKGYDDKNGAFDRLCELIGTKNIEVFAKRLRASGWGYYPRLNFAQGGLSDWGELPPPTGLDAILVDTPDLRNFILDILGNKKSIIEQTEDLFEVVKVLGVETVWMRPADIEIRDAYVYFQKEDSIFFLVNGEFYSYSKKNNLIIKSAESFVLGKMPDFHKRTNWIYDFASAEQVKTIASLFKIKESDIPTKKLSKWGASSLISSKINKVYLHKIANWIEINLPVE